MIRKEITSGGNLKGTTKHLLFAVVLLVLVGVWNGAWAQCQTPLFIQEGLVEANVMILFDNSGSMNEALYHPDYDQGIRYDGNYDSMRMYYIGSCKYIIHNNI